MADESSALFNQYENEYCNKSTDISRKISAITNLSGDLRRRKVAEVEGDIRDADQVIKRMDMEARSVPPEKSRQLLVKVKEYKADLSALKDELKKASSSASAGDAARAELGLGGDYSNSAAQRDRMLVASERLNKTTERLTQGRQQLYEAEELGVTILQDLARQRETIVHARDTLHGTDDNITKARKILSNMSKRIFTNKIIMFGISAFLIFAIILIIVLKLKR